MGLLEVAWGRRIHISNVWAWQPHPAKDHAFHHREQANVVDFDFATSCHFMPLQVAYAVCHFKWRMPLQVAYAVCHFKWRMPLQVAYAVCHFKWRMPLQVAC